jgi:hypothetical protein
MGYTTDFEGRFQIEPPLLMEDQAFLTEFAQVRHVKRNVGPEYGIEGEFYVKDETTGVLDYNKPPKTQPGLYCQWVPTENGSELEWDGGEKFYEYEKWLVYIIDKILKPRGYVLSGEVEWQGEDSSDFGKLVVKNNELTIKKGKKVFN